MSLPASVSAPQRFLPSQLHYRPLEDLDLSILPYRCLKQQDIQNLAQLLALTESQLMALPNFGVKSLAEVKARLAERGLPPLVP